MRVSRNEMRQKIKRLTHQRDAAETQIARERVKIRSLEKELEKAQADNERLVNETALFKARHRVKPVAEDRTVEDRTVEDLLHELQELRESSEFWLGRVKKAERERDEWKFAAFEIAEKVRNFARSETSRLLNEIEAGERDA